MNMRPIVLWAAALFVLAGCSHVAVGDLLANREKVLHDTMSPANLSSEVRKAVEDTATGASFTKMVVIFDASIEEDGRQRERRSVVRTLVNASKGLVERQDEWSNNEVPYRIINSLTYGGFLPLRLQEALLARDTTELARGVIEVVRFTPGALHPVDGKTYGYELKWRWYGAPGRITSSYTCRAGPSGPANVIHTSLKGEAVPLTCELKDEKGVLVERQDYAFLEDYGVAVDTGFASSNVKAKMKVIDVKITP
jgi:hypothetical protein